MITRRNFLQTGAFALCTWGAMGTSNARAAGEGTTGPLGKPIGIQLYTVREDARRDLHKTLETLVQIGYREVETAGFYGRTGKQMRALLAQHGLTAPAVHHSMADVQQDLEAKIDDAAAVDAKYFVIAFPHVPEGSLPAGRTIANGMTLEHWRWNADQLNKIGRLARKAGMQAAYHNHNMEFRTIDGKVAFDQLLAWTDPALVTIELDLAWVVTAGVDPVAYLQKHAERISLLHVKEVRKDARTTTDELLSQTTEVGRGKIDWQRLFAAASAQHIAHYFVEQENFEGPALDAVRTSFEYLSRLQA